MSSAITTCGCCQKLRVKMSIASKDKYSYKAENIKEGISTGKINKMTSGLPPNPKEINFKKGANEIIPLGLKLKRDRIKSSGANAENSAYTSSHAYPKTYSDDEMLAYFNVNIEIKNCDLSSALMEVVDKKDNTIIFKDDLENPIPRPIYNNPNFLKQGTHIWQWDAYDKNGVFDSQFLRTSKTLYLRLTYTCECAETGDTSGPHSLESKLEFKINNAKGEWLDLYIEDKDRVTGGSLPNKKIKPEAHYSPELDGWAPNTDVNSTTGIGYEVSSATVAAPAGASSNKIITLTTRLKFKEPSSGDKNKYGTIKHGSERTNELNKLNKDTEDFPFGYNDTGKVTPQAYNFMYDYIDGKKHLLSPTLPALPPMPTFQDLSKYAAKGLASCWSRPGQNRNVEVDSSANKGKQDFYEVSVKVELPDSRSSTLPEMSANLTLHPVITPAWIRSYSLSFLWINNANTYYNYGRAVGWTAINAGTEDSKKAKGKLNLRGVSLEMETASFKETLAHEVGHLILNMVYNSDFSLIHKYSSLTKQNSHPYLSCNNDVTGLKDIENDVMKYPHPNNVHYPKSAIASENDVRSLIGLVGLKVNLGSSKLVS